MTKIRDFVTHTLAQDAADKLRAGGVYNTVAGSVKNGYQLLVNPNDVERAERALEAECTNN